MATKQKKGFFASLFDSPKKKSKKRSSVGKIYKTTDGYLGGNKSNKKPRRVVTVAQRKSDGAIAVAKIHKKEGKDPKDRSKYIQGVELSPKKHPSLTEPSIVEKRAIFGQKNGNSYSPIYPTDVVDTGDRLKGKELCKVKRGIQNDTKKHRKTYKKTLKRWGKGFKE